MNRHGATVVMLIAVGSASLAVGCGDDEANDTSAAGASGPSSSASGQGGSGGGGPGGGGSTSSGGSGGTSMLSCDPAEGNMPGLKLTEIATGLNAPIQVKAAPDDPDRLYIVQQSGQILIHEGGQVLDTPFLDVSGELIAFFEEGLLGIAFHPDYAESGRFFVHYSDAETHDSTVMEYHRSDTDPLLADPSPAQLVLQHTSAELNHNGGSIEFGGDGYLYVALGDGGTQNDPGCDAKKTDTLLGKVSRLDVDAAATPDGFPAAAGNPDGQKWYHMGLRNPWRFTFDACTHDLFVGDVGQNAWEEVNAVPETSGPVDFGWPVREGAHDHTLYDNSCPQSSGAAVEPIAEYENSSGDAVTGGYVYRGSAIPGLRGTYFFANYNTGEVWTLRYEGGVATEKVEVPSLAPGMSISSFGQDGAGEVYIVDHNGSVFRIDAM
jgi:glucose/arabinose dehydrogenase